MLRRESAILRRAVPGEVGSGRRNTGDGRSRRAAWRSYRQGDCPTLGRQRRRRQGPQHQAGLRVRHDADAGTSRPRRRLVDQFPGEVGIGHVRSTGLQTQRERRTDPSPTAATFSLRKEPLSAARAWCGTLIDVRCTPWAMRQDAKEHSRIQRRVASDQTSQNGRVMWARGVGCRAVHCLTWLDTPETVLGPTAQERDQLAMLVAGIDPGHHAAAP